MRSKHVGSPRKQRKRTELQGWRHVGVRCSKQIDYKLKSSLRVFARYGTSLKSRYEILGYLLYDAIHQIYLSPEMKRGRSLRIDNAARVGRYRPALVCLVYLVAFYEVAHD
jgi:hypothetical protein